MVVVEMTVQDAAADGKGRKGKQKRRATTQEI